MIVKKNAWKVRDIAVDYYGDDAELVICMCAFKYGYNSTYEVRGIGSDQKRGCLGGEGPAASSYVDVIWM